MTFIPPNPESPPSSNDEGRKPKGCDPSMSFLPLLRFFPSCLPLAAPPPLIPWPLVDEKETCANMAPSKRSEAFSADILVMKGGGRGGLRGKSGCEKWTVRGRRKSEEGGLGSAVD